MIDIAFFPDRILHPLFDVSRISYHVKDCASKNHVDSVQEKKKNPGFKLETQAKNRIDNIKSPFSECPICDGLIETSQLIGP